MGDRVYRILIVDDEELARAVVKEHLAGRPDIEVVGEGCDGFEAVRLAAELKPDILFLDIQMPKLDGFEVLELLETKPAVVFVTAHDQHALKAFEVHAVDYLLKPFSEERFEEALHRAQQQSGRAAAPDPYALSQTARAGKPAERLVVKDGTRVTVIPLARLDYIQAQDDYVLLKTPEKGYLKQQTISGLEERLDASRFVRIHRSFILPLDRLVRLEQSDTERKVAVLADGTRLPVSRSGMVRLKKLLGDA